ncbi:ABC transporter permease [Natronoglycomyces albus]|uniref:Transport permease protein n=1 Tax=Natronoglycomyces albus TaxID=2811108 RepID=A0A895XQX0_9ACTN|nr:ABC transporter permease [Natronoglycomyces albus]QSB05769.1 ABC transporter permease [Natronoglycomyces albus]
MSQVQAVARSNRLGWALADGWTLTRRELLRWVRKPAAPLIGLLFPVLMILMFGYFLGGAMEVPGGGDYREFLLPGMFVLTMLFGMESTMMAVTTDAQRGLADRFRSLPMAGSAVLAGRGAADMVNAVVGLAVVMACGLLVGWQAHGSITQTLAAIGLLLWLRLAVTWVGIYLGLVANDPQVVVAVQIMVWPFAFASSVFVSPETMPGWLGALAQWNPISATAAATRELFGNPGFSGGSWVTDNSVLLAMLWPLVLLAIFVPLAMRKYRALGR